MTWRSDALLVFSRPLVSVGLFLLLAALPLSCADRNGSVQRGGDTVGVHDKEEFSRASITSPQPEAVVAPSETTAASPVIDPSGSTVPTGGARPNPMPEEPTST